MVVAAAVPLFGRARANWPAFCTAGDLLNRRYELVDSIKREVFPDETYEGKEHRNRNRSFRAICASPRT